MSPEEAANQQLDRRIEESRLRLKLDQPDPTDLFAEMERERDTIVQQRQSTLPEFASQQTSPLQPITQVVVSPPLRATSGNGIVAIDFDSAVGGAFGAGGGGTDSPGLQLPLLVFTNGAVTAINFLRA